MKAFNRRRRSAAVCVSGVVVALVGVTAAAQAADVTNPAQHPAPVKVTIDGQTYHDGLDTLPGYDDEACTPIPNVQYDFANDEIQYYDSQGELLTTAHWTEWSRISSYQDWVDQQHAGSPSPTPTPAPSSTPPPAPSTSSTPAPSTSTSSSSTTSPAATRPAAKTKSPAAKTKTPATTRPSTTSHATKSPTSSSHTASSPSSPGTASSTPKEAAPSHASKKSGTPATSDAATNPAPAAAPTVAAASSTSPSSGATPAPSGTTPAPSAGDPSPASSPQGTPKYKLASARTGVGASAGDTRAAGVVILAALAAVACFAFLFGWANRPDFARRGSITYKKG